MLRRTVLCPRASFAAWRAASDAVRLTPGGGPASPSPCVALTHVRVVDGTGAAPVEDQTILLRDGKIAEVGRTCRRSRGGAQSWISRDTRSSPGSSACTTTASTRPAAAPCSSTFSAPRLYLAQRCHHDPDDREPLPLRGAQPQAATSTQGEVAGPRMYVTGPYLTGETGIGGMYNLRTPKTRGASSPTGPSEGVTWLKFYTTDQPRGDAGARSTRPTSTGVKVTGHLCSVSYSEAVALGIDNLEHGLFANTDYVANKKPDECPARRWRRSMPWISTARRCRRRSRHDRRRTCR